MLSINAILQNRYRLVGLLGRGGMGSVYLAEDMHLGGRRVAVKEMNPVNLPSQDRSWALDAFRQEAHMLAQLSHPGLTAVMDYFPQNGLIYLVMEYVPGESLEKVWEKAGGRFPEAQVVTWAEQLCDVLAYLHTQQPAVIFRDLKPSNIMVQPDGRLKLIDFGIARYFKPGQTRDTVPLGTPGYAPPEQHGQGQADPRSDVYALGAVLHQLLTGHDPAHTPFHLPPLKSLNPGVSTRVSAAVTQALQLDPQQRPATMTAMNALLHGRQPIIPAGLWAAGGLLLLALLIFGFSRLWLAPLPPTLAGEGVADERVIPVTVVVTVTTTVTAPLPTAPPTIPPAAPTATSSPPPTVTPLPTASPTTQMGSNSATPPLLSPNGRLAFVSNRAGKDSLYVMDVQNPAGARQLTEAVGYDWWPHWCGADTILFERADDIFSPTWMEIAYVAANGGAVTLVTSADLPVGSKVNGFPSCSPDGRFLAFSSLAQAAARSNDYKVGLVDLAASVARFDLVGDGYPLGGDVTWSPDSQAIAFMHLPAGETDFQIYRVSLADPYNPLNLTMHFDGNSKYPTWSPLGDQIAFACSQRIHDVQEWGLCITPSNRPQVTMLLADLHSGSERDQATNSAHHAITPTWSPDGRWLAFASDQDGDWDIYLYAVATGELINLTADWPSDEMHPDWGP